MRGRHRRAKKVCLVLCVGLAFVTTFAVVLAAPRGSVWGHIAASSDPVEDWLRAYEDGGAMRIQVLEQARYAYAGPAVGDPAPDFTLRTLDGRETTLRDFIGRLPVVLEFGNLT